jgi:hypothetical protein
MPLTASRLAGLSRSLTDSDAWVSRTSSSRAWFSTSGVPLSSEPVIESMRPDKLRTSGVSWSRVRVVISAASSFIAPNTSVPSSPRISAPTASIVGLSPSRIATVTSASSPLACSRATESCGIGQSARTLSAMR